MMKENKFPGLYIHIPFCLKKCRYCDFVSYTGQQDLYDKYIDALFAEAERYKGTVVDTVFVGGGTPTALSCTQISRLLEGIGRIFTIKDDAEFSMESNPGTTDEEKLKVIKSCGVNRLSIGVQSFDDNELKMLGRIHSSKQALNAIEAAQKYFNNINIDIMTAIPGQTDQSLERTLATAVATGVQHLSCYSLILEEGTPLEEMVSTGKLTVPDEEQDRKMYSNMCSFLKANGYERYEISNFSKPEKRCRHNLKYWNTNEYIGIGTAAHSYLNNKRFYNCADLNKYIASPGEPEETIVLSIDDMIGEYIIMALRTTGGVDLKEFKERFGIDFVCTYGDKIDRFSKVGFIKLTDQRCFLTDKGIDVSNSIMCEFL